MGEYASGPGSSLYCFSRKASGMKRERIARVRPSPVECHQIFIRFGKPVMLEGHGGDGRAGKHGKMNWGDDHRFSIPEKLRSFTSITYSVCQRGTPGIVRGRKVGGGRLAAGWWLINQNIADPLVPKLGKVRQRGEKKYLKTGETGRKEEVKRVVCGRREG